MVNNESEFRVKVAVRVRPFLSREKTHEQKSCVAIHPETNQIVLGDRRTFKYDFVFGPKTHQEELYQTCVEPVLANVFDGYNVTILTYGQTGSGKTFTMTGGNMLSIGEEDYGIVPRAVNTIFQTFHNHSDVQINISASYLEIYKDDIIDLLDVTDKALDVRDDAIGNTVVIGASEHRCDSVTDVVNLLKKGSTVRHTGATQMNDESSRSHAIFTLYIEQRVRDHQTNGNMVQVSYDGLVRPLQSAFGDNYLSAKLHFVDLAGSERVSRTLNTGERFQESIRINSGLLALGNVVSALSDPKKRAGGHIPYRDSKLTRLLKDSLGGNAKTLMITCISPCLVDLDESLNALKYAHRASQIRNKPIKNVDPNAQRFIEMQSEITHLREELERQRNLFSRTGQSMTTGRSNVTSNSDHSRRLIYMAHTYFQQLYQAEELTHEQKQWIQHWLEAVSNENSDELFNDLSTYRMTHLENALHSAQDELKSENQRRIDREIIVDQLKQELEAKNKELVRIRETLERINDQRQLPENSLMKSTVNQEKFSNEYFHRDSKSINRIQSAPFASGRGSAKIFNEKTIKPRPIHSSPANFNMTYVVERFHDRSLAIAHSREEIEELDLGEKDQLPIDERRLSRQGTYRVRKSRVIAKIIDQQESVENLRQSTMKKQRLIDETKRKVEEAQSQAQDLSLNIQLKERLIQSVFTSTKSVKTTNEHYEEHIEKLEKEVEKAKLEYNELQKTIQQLTTRTTNEKSKSDSEYRKKCDMAKTRLESLQRKEKQYRQLMIQLTNNNEKKMIDLQATLFRMKQQYETALKRIREETELKNKFEQELFREQQRLQELTIQHDQQQKVLKLKSEGLVAAQRKLRQVTNGNLSEGLTTWENEMERLLNERKELEMLRNDVEKRRELIEKREGLLRERTELETKQKSKSNHQTVREELLRQKQNLTERMEKNNSMITNNDQRRLIEIDEAIEAVELAIDFQNNIIRKREHEVEQSIRASQGPDSALFKIGQLTDNECKELCRNLFEKVIDLKEEENRERQRYDELKSQCDEKNRTIVELQSRIQSLSLDYDRRLTSIQQNYEDEKQILINQIEELTNQMKQLEKDLFFYRHKTRELRQSLINENESSKQIQTSQSSFRLTSTKSQHRSSSNQRPS